MGINYYSKRIIQFLGISLYLSFTLFGICTINKQIKAEKNIVAANENDLDLYHRMGVQFLCNATRKGIDLDFQKTLSVASATYASVISQKHGGKIIKSKKERTVNVKQLQFVAALQFVETALMVCPDHVPEKVEKQAKIEIERLKKLQGLQKQ